MPHGTEGNWKTQEDTKLGDALRHFFFIFFEKSTRISIKNRFFKRFLMVLRVGTGAKWSGGYFFPLGMTLQLLKKAYDTHGNNRNTVKTLKKGTLLVCKGLVCS